MENGKTLEIFRGLPASGKSTEAKRRVREDLGGTVRVNRDLFRIMLHDNEFDKSLTEPLTITARDAMIEKFLKLGKTVIVDDTNLAPKVVKSLAKLAQKHGAVVKVVDFDVPIDECIKRDAARAGKGEVSVGEDVIRRMHKDFFKKGFPANPLGKNVIEGPAIEPYVIDPNLPRAVIFDIDGTLASHENIRSPYDYTKVLHDTPRQAVIDTAKMYVAAGHRLIVLSGRDGSCESDTHKWLANHLWPLIPDNEFELHMRPAGDTRADYIIKLELFNEHVRGKFYVHAVYDDRDQVVKLWRDLGLNCFQVNYGDF